LIENVHVEKNLTCLELIVKKGETKTIYEL